jgi:hypothetical protein
VGRNGAEALYLIGDKTLNPASYGEVCLGKRCKPSLDDALRSLKAVELERLIILQNRLPHKLEEEVEHVLMRLGGRIWIPSGWICIPEVEYHGTPMQERSQASKDTLHRPSLFVMFLHWATRVVQSDFSQGDHPWAL